MNRPTPVAEAGAATKYERRASIRHACHLEAISHAVEPSDAITWGALVEDVSREGLRVRLCFPFKPGTLLAVELRTGATRRTLLARVVHVKDEDGAWIIGGRFETPLTDQDIAQLL